ncbi:hypothetical protein ACPWR0_18920 [Pandoraea pneumonica]|uniref:hypothetical protein n=1 Tax=Pandoraea pneumonica TaxID=2508299 RepID=UPI003CF5FCDC
MEFLVVHYAAVVVELVDGPDCRKARLRISGEDVEVIHDDPYGNTIRACDIGANVIIKSVADDLLGRLAGF